jgi:hypothetical protein
MKKGVGRSDAQAPSQPVQNLCGAVGMLAEERAQHEQQIPHPAKSAHRKIRSGQAGFGMTGKEEEKAHRPFG